MQTARMFFFDWTKIIINKKYNDEEGFFSKYCLCMIMFHGVDQFLVEIQEEELVKTEK